MSVCFFFHIEKERMISRNLQSGGVMGLNLWRWTAATTKRLFITRCTGKDQGKAITLMCAVFGSQTKYFSAKGNKKCEALTVKIFVCFCTSNKHNDVRNITDNF